MDKNCKTFYAKIFVKHFPDPHMHTPPPLPSFISFSHSFISFLIGKKVILLREKNKRYIEFTVVNKEQNSNKRKKGIKILF